jgi:broad specificity phosphatase PhoE
MKRTTSTTVFQITGLVMSMQASLDKFGADALASQEIIFIRHGRTEMNEYLAQPGKDWGSKDFFDPGMYDTKLTTEGIQQAKKLRVNAPKVDLLCVSPLRRALETATHAYDLVNQPTIRTLLQPLCAERVYMAADVGSTALALESEFGGLGFDFSSLIESTDGGQSPWWWTGDSTNYDEWRPDGTYCCRGEPSHEFEKRMLMFKSWLSFRPERRIGVVCHWGTIQALTGESVANCATVHVPMAELLKRPIMIAE